MKTMIAMSLVAALLVPFAVADVIPVDTSAAGGSLYYIDSDDATVWEESNDCEGLQKEAFDCDGDGETEAHEVADTQL